MRKYENVDIIASLGAVMEINTEHYKSDFQYDIKMFMDAAKFPDADNTRLLWLSRKSGTHSFLERNVYLKGTYAHNTWKYHAATKDTILAYAVEIKGLENGRVKGDLYELDYRRHAREVEKNALPTETVDIKFKNGMKKSYPFEEYDKKWSQIRGYYGAAEEARHMPENLSELKSVLKQAHAERQKYTPAVFKLRNSQKQSILKQLKEDKARAAPKKDIAKSKNIELE